VTPVKSKNIRGGFSSEPGVGIGSAPSASTITVTMPPSLVVTTDCISGGV
jgi:hypothetical protein